MAIRRFTPEEMAYYEAQRARLARPAQLRQLKRDRKFFVQFLIVNIIWIPAAWWLILGGFHWVLWGNVAFAIMCAATVVRRHLKIRKVQVQLEQDAGDNHATA